MEHLILANGIGTRERMAAFRKVARNVPADTRLSDVLDTAAALLVQAHAADVRKARKADSGPVKDSEPVADAPKRGRGRPVGSKDSKPRKSRKAANVKADAPVKADTDTVPCMACFSQTPRKAATFYADLQAYTCPSCDAEAAEEELEK